MNKKKANLTVKKIDYKKYLWDFIRIFIVLLLMLIISNALKKTDLFKVTEIIAITISSVILVSFKLLFETYCK